MLGGRLHQERHHRWRQPARRVGARHVRPGGPSGLRPAGGRHGGSHDRHLGELPALRGGDHLRTSTRASRSRSRSRSSGCEASSEAPPPTTVTSSSRRTARRSPWRASPWTTRPTPSSPPSVRAAPAPGTRAQGQRHRPGRVDGVGRRRDGQRPGREVRNLDGRPHVAGVAALNVQAHPRWSAQDIAANLVNTADPSKVGDYRLTLGGTGLIDVKQSVANQVTAVGDSYTTEDGRFREATLSFGFAESTNRFSDRKTRHPDQPRPHPGHVQRAQRGDSPDASGHGHAQPAPGHRSRPGRSIHGHGEPDRRHGQGRLVADRWAAPSTRRPATWCSPTAARSCGCRGCWSPGPHPTCRPPCAPREAARRI